MVTENGVSEGDWKYWARILPILDHEGNTVTVDVQGKCPANCSAEMSNAYSSMVSDAHLGCRLVGRLSASMYLLTICL